MPGSVDSPIRVVVVAPEPTPYRAPLFDLIAERPELDLTVVYAAGAIAGNRWDLTIGHPHVVLRGFRVPGADRILRHDYPVTPGVVRALERLRPDVLVITGWSTFASQAALAWSAVRRVPYVLQVESHDMAPRRAWRKAVKGAVVPRVVRRASSVLVTGTLARRSMVARGADPGAVRIFANTVDTGGFAAAAETARLDRQSLRAAMGIDPDDIVVLSVARLSPEKALDSLIGAVEQAARARLRLVLAGEGGERGALERLARERGVRVTFLGVVEREDIVRVYVAADVFALLSRNETWGVVVNEAAACGLPLVLSDQVGAAHDLLDAGVNGYLVPADHAEAHAAAALRDLCDDVEMRWSAGRRSREIAAVWGYGPSVESFVTAVRAAVAGQRQ